MKPTYEIHPRIGVARVGNSTEFYLAPETIGGLPIKCDSSGNATTELVERFKDDAGRILRQAAKFRIFEKTANGHQLVKLSDVNRIEWTVHIANKKPIWYTFSELQGDLEFGGENSYEKQHCPVNNPTVTGEARQQLIIDPGPRSVDQPGHPIEISRYNIPKDYPHGSFPSIEEGGTQIDILGELKMDDDGNLIALGAFGNVTGDATISGFRGAGGYWDDVSDGIVMVTIELTTGEKIDLEPAWLIVGSPKYAPELINITTLYDTMYSTAIRHLNGDQTIYDADKYCDGAFSKHKEYTPLKGFNPDYKVSYTTQIKPIIDRIRGYRWVADVPYLDDFSSPGFDLSDSSETNKKNRVKYFGYFRVPVLPEDYDKWVHTVKNGPNTLFSQDGIPLMPLNSGDNSVTNNGPIYKFETLSATQYFFMNQWAEGKVEVGAPKTKSYAEQLDEASVGNCVGAPFSPGIEVTWSTRNAAIYQAPLHLKPAHFEGSNSSTQTYYQKHGLSITANETEGSGCEPGDMTKRMAIPWQSDFAYCTVQTPNITLSTVNQAADGSGIEVPPAYYVYWWPPQSPMHVVAGSVDPSDQVLDAIVSGDAKNNPIVAAGQRVPFQRGIASPAAMIANWHRLGFILNQGDNDYPYYVEKERNSIGLAQYTELQKGGS
jgi:L-lysine 6-oxidase